MGPSSKRSDEPPITLRDIYIYIYKLIKNITLIDLVFSNNKLNGILKIDY